MIVTVIAAMISYPVVAFKGKHMFVYESADAFQTCNKQGLKNGFHKGLEIVDSDGRKFRVNRAVPVGYVPPFWGYRLFESRNLKIELEMTEMESVDFHQFKALILTRLPKSHAGADVSALKKQVTEASTFRQIIEVLK